MRTVKEVLKEIEDLQKGYEVANKFSKAMAINKDVENYIKQEVGVTYSDVVQLAKVLTNQATALSLALDKCEVDV